MLKISEIFEFSIDNSYFERIRTVRMVRMVRSLADRTFQPRQVRQRPGHVGILATDHDGELARGSSLRPPGDRRIDETDALRREGRCDFPRALWDARGAVDPERARPPHRARELRGHLLHVRALRHAADDDVHLLLRTDELVRRLCDLGVK